MKNISHNAGKQFTHVFDLLNEYAEKVAVSNSDLENKIRCLIFKLSNGLEISPERYVRQTNRVTQAILDFDTGQHAVLKWQGIAKYITRGIAKVVKKSTGNMLSVNEVIA